MPTTTLSGLAVDDEIDPEVGTAVAVSVTEPLADGRQVHVAEKLEPEPAAVLFLHPAIITFFARKVTFAATLTFAVIVTTVLNAGVPLIENELKLDVSITFVTVIVIA